MLEAIKLMHGSSKEFGKDMSTTTTWKARMEKTGFANVTEEVYKVCAFAFSVELVVNT